MFENRFDAAKQLVVSFDQVDDDTAIKLLHEAHS